MQIGEEAYRPLADLGVQIGVNLQPDQTLVVMAEPEMTGPVRAVARSAYARGARHVHVLFQDPVVTRIRLESASEASLGEFPTWLASALIDEARGGAAFLNIVGGDPDALEGIDPNRIATVQRAGMAVLKPYVDLQMSHRVAWSILSAPSLAWARKVFPEKDEASAFDELWRLILFASRADGADPLKAWRGHMADLEARRRHLNDLGIESLHFEGPGTDLTIALPETYQWMATGQMRPVGYRTAPNIPSEEVFTLARRDGVEGTVRSTRSLSYGGQTIEGMRFTFESGRVVEAHADVGEAALRVLLETDDGAGRLGEVALVPEDSPIAASGIEFHNTLYDENASCHLAFGRAYPTCLTDGEEVRSDEDLIAKGGNTSQIHVDFMVGSEDLDITATLVSGAAAPIFRRGRWAEG